MHNSNQFQLSNINQNLNHLLAKFNNLTQEQKNNEINNLRQSIPEQKKPIDFKKLFHFVNNTIDIQPQFLSNAQKVKEALKTKLSLNFYTDNDINEVFDNIEISRISVNEIQISPKPNNKIFINPKNVILKSSYVLSYA